MKQVMILPSVIRKAKHADLPSVISGLGFELCREGRGFYARDHDSLKLFQRQGIWLYKWWSRNGEVGDGIQFLRRFYNMDFHEAVALLSGESVMNVRDKGRRENRHQNSEKCSLVHWQKKAERLVSYAQKNIFEPSGRRCLEFLICERGLQEHTIRKFRLGWLPAKGHMPSKLVIPCFSSRGSLMRIRFRIDNPAPGATRYRVMKGSNTHSSFPSGITPGKPVIIVESELDAILIHQEAGLETGVLALGTAANDFSERPCRFLARKIPFNLICLDNDRCGKSRTNYFMNKLPNSVSWPVPGKYGKDPGEAWKKMSISRWIADGISSAKSIIYKKRKEKK